MENVGLPTLWLFERLWGCWDMGEEGEGELLPAPGIFEVRNSCSVKALLACSVPVHTLFISNMFSITKTSQKQTCPVLSGNISIEVKGMTVRSGKSYIQYTWLGCERCSAFPDGVMLICTIWRVWFLSLSMHILESHFGVWNVAEDSSVLQHHLTVMEDCSEVLQMLSSVLLEKRLPWGLVICTVNWAGDNQEKRLFLQWVDWHLRTVTQKCHSGGKVFWFGTWVLMFLPNRCL